MVKEKLHCLCFEALQGKVAFYHNKGADILKIACTLPNVAKFCVHKSTTAKPSLFAGNDMSLLEKSAETWWINDQECLEVKLFLMKALFGSPITFAN